MMTVQIRFRLLVPCVLLMIAGCGADPETLILGQWQGTAINEHAESDGKPPPRADLHLGFFADSRCTFRLDTDALFLANMPTLPCRWMLSEDARLKLEITTPGGDVAVETFFLSIDDDELTLRDPAAEEALVLTRQRP